MKILDKKEYDFLRTNKDLSQIIYLVMSGSHAYGTSVPNSDIDLRGVLIEPKKCLYGLQAFEQYEDLPSDTVIYGLKKFISLLSKANPNTIELLGVDEECIVKMTARGKMLRENAELFLSTRVASSFGNIATRRKEEQNLLMDVRNGKIPFEEIFKLADDYQSKFNKAAKITKLPYEPNANAIDNLMIKLYEMVE